MSKRAWIIAAAAAALCCLCAVPIGAVAGWWLLLRNPEAIAPPAANVAKALSPSMDGWGYQQLQDHLAKRGLKTSRAQGKKGMWFREGDGKPINYGELQVCDYGGDPYGAGYFLVRNIGTTAEAEREAKDIRDVRQRDALPFGPFVIEGSSNKLAELRRILK